MSKKCKVAILYGGRSVEHEISLRSAANVVANIDRSRFDPVLIGIDTQGSWFLNDIIDKNISAGKPVSLTLNTKKPGLQVGELGEVIVPDVVFPVLHGTDGEDGSIQGLFTALDFPVVGSGVLGSAVSMDKIISKKILHESGLPVAPYLDFHKSEKTSINFNKVKDTLGLPFMVKSAALGSSVGISKVTDEASFEAALTDSFLYGDKIIVESFVQGRELECAVLGNEPPRASFPGEILLVKEYDFYTYEAKYLDEDAIKIQLPARIDAETTDKIRRKAVEAYEVLCCEDFARVDIFLTKDNGIIINEINTIPGFTSASMFPMMWQQMGMSYTDLISTLVDLCLERHAKKKMVEKQYNSGK